MPLQRVEVGQVDRGALQKEGLRPESLLLHQDVKSREVRGLRLSLPLVVAKPRVVVGIIRAKA